MDTLKVSYPKGTTHVHADMWKAFKSDGDLDERMFEKWESVSWQKTSSKVFTWNGKSWSYYDTFKKTDKHLKGSRIKLFQLKMFTFMLN